MPEAILVTNWSVIGLLMREQFPEQQPLTAAEKKTTASS